ncbi:MAG TPA: hypothetical protein ENK10_01840 [Acidobacteria bacterium]|nr:hypothetical protein [Acidobacteriota bacterium]
MARKLKSAYELAMERLEAAGQSSAPPLSEAQKEAIERIRKQAAARRDEVRFEAERELARLAGEGDSELLERRRREVEQQLARIGQEEEEQVRAVRVGAINPDDA